ncbi:hypothetical protein BGZ91_006334 [Linnemannia elongata]|nr:hypothetical protein BGZ91_006334 [Linnemannia elongata]
MQKTSGHQKSLPPADSASPYVMKDLLDWVLTRPKENEDVGMPEFAAQFGFHSENSAHELFVQVLQSTAIPYAKRQRLIRQYDLWRDSKGEEFWADRAAAHRVRVSMKKAVDEILKGSDGLREHYINTNSHSALQAISSTSSNVTSSQAGKKHPRDPLVELNEALPKTPCNASLSPTIVSSENIDSPNMTQSGYTLPNPFLDNNTDEPDDDEQLDAVEEDENNGQDFLLPDKVEREFDFIGNLDGLDLAIGFKPFFAAVKKKAVYIEDTDEALGRSGIVFLRNEGSAIQQEYFGMDGLAHIRQKMLEYWHTADVTASRNKARVWLDLIADKNYDRTEILVELAKSSPTNPIDRKLWVFLLGAVSKFPVKDTTKLYSESTGLSSYVLPLCQAFMGDPEKMVFLNFVDKTTVSGKSRTGTKSKREPDLVLELKDQSNKTLCELGIGEGTSHAHKNYRKKNAKDLARIGLGLKDALDLIQDRYGVVDATLVGYQVIGQTMSIYLMRCCGNMYVMVHVHDLSIPDSMKELAIIGAEYNIWFELALTVENGIKPVLNAAAKGKVTAVLPPLGVGKTRFRTVLTPELNKLLKRM